MRSLDLLGRAVAASRLRLLRAWAVGDQAMFAGLAELKAERLPHLEEVLFPKDERVILVNEETRLAYEEVGVALLLAQSSRERWPGELQRFKAAGG